MNDRPPPSSKKPPVEIQFQNAEWQFDIIFVSLVALCMFGIAMIVIFSYIEIYHFRR